MRSAASRKQTASSLTEVSIWIFQRKNDADLGQWGLAQAWLKAQEPYLTPHTVAQKPFIDSSMAKY